MSDNLVIFGQTYNNVAGVKATDTQDQTVIFRSGGDSSTPVNIAVYDNRVEDYSSTDVTSAYCYGKVVVINICCKVKKTLTTAQTTLYTMPEGYRPQSFAVFMGLQMHNQSQTQTTFYGGVNPGNGNVNIFHTGTVQNDAFVGQVVYTID